MTGWIIAFGIAILAMAALCFIGRIPRVTREVVAAALLVGLAGYAWQGSPALPGKPYCDTHCAMAYVPAKRKVGTAA